MIATSTLDWNKFKVFYHITKAGSFSEAAQVLNITQSALSRTIKNLEDRIQIKLFVRNSRGVTLTPQGKVMFEAVQKMHEEFVRCDLEVQKVEQDLKGYLKVALLRSISSLSLTKNLLDFQKEHPNITLNLILCDKVEDFKILNVDIALMPSFEKQKDLSQSYICSLHQKLYASSSYLKTYGTPQNYTDLRSHHWIRFNEEEYIGDSVSSYEDVSRRLTPSRFYINSYAQMCQAVEQNMGIAALPVETNPIYQNSFVEVLPEITTKEVPLYLIYPHYLKNFKKVEMFETYIKKVLRTVENFTYGHPNLLAE